MPALRYHIIRLALHRFAVAVSANPLRIGRCLERRKSAETQLMASGLIPTTIPTDMPSLCLLSSERQAVSREVKASHRSSSSKARVLLEGPIPSSTIPMKVKKQRGSIITRSCLYRPNFLFLRTRYNRWPLTRWSAAMRSSWSHAWAPSFAISIKDPGTAIDTWTTL